MRRAFRDGVVYPKNPHREEVKIRQALDREALELHKLGRQCRRLVKQTSPRNLSFGGGNIGHLSHLDYYKKRVTLAPNPFEAKR